MSDRGVQFVSAVFDLVVRAMGTAHRLTTAYHPQSNQTERVNRTMKTAIRSYVGSKHRDWDRHLGLISFALQTAPHQSTGDSPAFLLYGRDLNTPLDLTMQPDVEPAPESLEAYKSELSSALRDAYDHVRQCLSSSQDSQKNQYDKRRRHVSFKPGDLVRLRAHPRSDASVGFAAKLALLYKGPYRVDQVMSDLNFKLSSVADSSYAGVHHVSNLLPFHTWGQDTQGSQSNVALAAEPGGEDSAVELLEEVEVPEYGFDFLFVGDDGQDEHLLEGNGVPPSATARGEYSHSLRQHRQLSVAPTHSYSLRSRRTPQGPPH